MQDDKISNVLINSFSIMPSDQTQERWRILAVTTGGFQSNEYGSEVTTNSFNCRVLLEGHNCITFQAQNANESTAFLRESMIRDPTLGSRGTRAEQRYFSCPQCGAEHAEGIGCMHVRCEYTQC